MPLEEAVVCHPLAHQPQAEHHRLADGQAVVDLLGEIHPAATAAIDRTGAIRIERDSSHSQDRTGQLVRCIPALA